MVLRHWREQGQCLDNPPIHRSPPNTPICGLQDRGRIKRAAVYLVHTMSAGLLVLLSLVYHASQNRSLVANFFQVGKYILVISKVTCKSYVKYRDRSIGAIDVSKIHVGTHPTIFSQVYINSLCSIEWELNKSFSYSDYEANTVGIGIMRAFQGRIHLLGTYNLVEK